MTTIRKIFKDTPIRHTREEQQEIESEKCSNAKSKLKILSKSLQIGIIERKNISSAEKVRRIKNLFPRDKCVHDVIDYEYSIHTPRTRQLEEKFG